MTTTQSISQILYSQIDKRVLMSLGMTNLFGLTDGIMFEARILPMTQKGRGARARVMQVTISLDATDTYSIKVTYAKGRTGRVTHFKESGVYAHNLNRLLLSLDYDGEEVTNPRHWHSV